MDASDVTTFVEPVVDDAEHTFGRNVDPTLLETYAREAVLDLWLTQPRVTGHVAELALSQVRGRIARRATATGTDRAAWEMRKRAA